MKIGVLNSLYQPYHRGGAEIIASIMVSDLEKLGHEVFVISTSPKKSYQDNNNYYLESKYYELNKIPTPLRLFWHINNLFDYKQKNRVKRIIKNEKPDLIITHNLMGLGLQLPKLFKGLKIKHIHIIHDIQLLHPSGLMFYQQEGLINSFFARKYQLITRNLIGSPAAVICPSEWLLGLHKEKGFFPQSIKKTIPNPVKTNYLSRDKDRNKTGFLSVGLVSKHKGSDTLIKAFNQLPELKLTIIGDGDYLEEAKNIANNNITFLGRLDYTKVQEYLLEASALIVPSLCYENSPTNIYQAVGSKLPVIGSNLAGTAELINKYGGLLFEPGNAEDLIEKIRYFLNNYDELNKNFPKEPLPPDDYVKQILQMRFNTQKWLVII
ncbi:MAG: glycosyltransferase [Candidatus Falkowbacteria bacterium]